MAHLFHLLTCILASWVGTRTLVIWTHTRRIPELAIGSSVLLIAIAGAVYAVIGGVYLVDGLEPPRASMALVIITLAAHIVATLVGSLMIYRPRSRTARAFVAMGTALTLIWVGLAFTNDRATLASSSLLLGLRFAAMSWAALEALRYAAMLRRRIPLGLADPLTAHRFQLWGAGATAQTGVIVCELMSWLRTGAGLDSTSAGVNVMAVFGLAGTLAVAFAFFPPAVYSEYIAARGAARESA